MIGKARALLTRDNRWPQRRISRGRKKSEVIKRGKWPRPMFRDHGQPGDRSAGQSRRVGVACMSVRPVGRSVIGQWRIRDTLFAGLTAYRRDKNITVDLLVAKIAD